MAEDNSTVSLATAVLWNCTTGEGGVTSSASCYNTKISGSQIISGMVINLCIGLLCYTGFVLWRDKFRFYTNRLCLPDVPPSKRPPALDVSGLRRLWSWLAPVFLVSDKELLESAGLDALMAQRIIGFGCMMFAPMTVLGVGVLLPVNYTAYVPMMGPQNTTSSADDEFLKMTMSAIPQGSSLLWIHFVFTYIFIAWVCFLLITYYKEFISLRQAHDEQLVRSAELGRRTSALDAQEQAAAHASGSCASQIMSQMRLRLSLASAGSVRSGGTAGGGNGAQHVTVRFTYDAPGFQLGSREHSLGSALGSGSTNGGMAEEGPSTAGAGAQESSLRQQQGQAQAKSKEGLPRGPAHKASLSLISEGDEGVGDTGGHSTNSPAKAALPSSNTAADVLAAAGTATSSADLALDIRESPFHSSSVGLRALGRSGSVGRDSGDVGSLQWDELGEPFPLLQTADAAQFYTVLIVDEALEEFAHRHEEKPWIWKLPKKIANTPRASRNALHSVFEETKALALLADKKAKLRLQECERRMEVAEQTYRDIFGEDFDRIVPLYHHQAVDALLLRWHAQRLRLERLQLRRDELRAKLHRLEKQDRIDSGEDAEAQHAQHTTSHDEEAAAVVPAKGGHSSGDTAGGGAVPAGGMRRRRWLPCGGPLTAEQRLKKAARLEVQLAAKEEQVLGVDRALASLQGEIEEAQIAAAEAMPAPCFFATFHSAKAAAYAARLNLNPLHERMMRALPAPAPNNINYTALLRGWMARGSRPIAVFFFVLVMLIFPIGTFAGICGTIVSSVCGTAPGSTTLSADGSWFCSDNKFAAFLRNIISSILPSILLTVWQAVVLPLWFYTCAQAEGTHFSLTSLDLRCANWFYLHDLLNVFLGGMLGGSVLYGLRAVINEPGQFFTILGQAVPASSNFFINFVSFKGIAMAPFRLFFPHAIIFGHILKWLRIVPSPKTERDKLAAAPPISIRYSRDLGVLQLTVFVVSMGYAVISPIILPFASLYFLLTWPVWRYQLLYVYQGHYSCGGQFWVYCAHRIVVSLGVMSSFTAAVMAVKGGYVAALILFFTSLAFLVWFDRYLAYRYDAVVEQLPAVGILQAPPARVEDRLYVPPPMRHRAEGWTPEWGKAWYGYGAPRFGL